MIKIRVCSLLLFLSLIFSGCSQKQLSPAVNKGQNQNTGAQRIEQGSEEEIPYSQQVFNVTKFTTRSLVDNWPPQNLEEGWLVLRKMRKLDNS